MERRSAITPRRSKTISSHGNLSKPRRRLHELNRRRAVSDYSQAIRLRLDDFESWKGPDWRSRLWDAIATPLRIWTRHQAEAGRDRCYLERGFSWGQLGDFKRAITDFDRVVQLRPRDPRVYALRGGAFARTDELQKASDDFTRRLEFCRIRRSCTWRGRASSLRSAPPASAGGPNKAVNLAPTSADVWVARGGSYHQLGSTNWDSPTGRRPSASIRNRRRRGWRAIRVFPAGQVRQGDHGFAGSAAVAPSSTDVIELLARAKLPSGTGRWKRLRRRRRRRPQSIRWRAAVAAAPVWWRVASGGKAGGAEKREARGAKKGNSATKPPGS